MQAAPVPSVAITVEKVTNKATGVEIKASDFRLEKQQGKIFGGKTLVNYQIIVFTNKARSLGCRSAEKHQEIEDGQDVTFTIEKSYDEILHFRNLLDKKFSGSYFPPFPKNAVQSTSTVIEQRNQARNGIKDINLFFKKCCDQKKIVFQDLFLNFFGFKLTASIEKISSKKSTTADTKEFIQKKLDIFDEEQDDSSDLFGDENIEDDNELFLQQDKDKQNEFSTTKSFKMFDYEKSEEKKDKKVIEKHKHVENVDEDLSSLLSKLKTVKKFDVKKYGSENVKEEKSELTGSSETGEISESIDEENLLEYLNNNAVTEEISLDFD